MVDQDNSKESSNTTKKPQWDSDGHIKVNKYMCKNHD